MIPSRQLPLTARAVVTLLRSEHLAEKGSAERALPFSSQRGIPTEPSDAELQEMAWPELMSEVAASGARSGDAAARALRVMQDKTSTSDGVNDHVGALSVLLGSIGHHPDHVSVQQFGISTLANMCAREDCSQAAVDAGALVIVLHAMDTHPELAAIQECGCWALANIAAGETRAQAAVEAGALTAVLRAMDAHQRHEGVQEQACLALSNICLWEDKVGQSLKDAAATAGALPALVRAMSVVRSHAGVQTWACWAIASISIGRPDLVESLRTAGVAIAVAATKRSHAGDPSVMAAAEVLTNLVGKHGELIKHMRQTPTEAGYVYTMAPPQA